MTPAFRFHASDRRASFSTHVELDSSPRANLERALSTLPSLPNLRKVSIVGWAISQAFGGQSWGALGANGLAAIQDALQALKTQPTFPALSHIEAASTADLMALLPNLRYLDCLYLGEGAWDTLFNALGNLPALQHLGIDLVRINRGEVASSRVPKQETVEIWNHHAPLRTLELYVCSLDDDALAFAHCWHHVKTLRIEGFKLSTSALALPDDHLPTLVLPPIQHLELAATSTSANFIGPFLSRLSPTPSLQSLTLDTHGNRSKPSATSLCDTLIARLENNDARSLRAINISFAEGLDMRGPLARLEVACEKRGVLLERL